MNPSKIIFVINDDVRGIACSYEPSSSPSIKPSTTVFKSFDQTLKPGDFVVVPTDTRHDMTVVRVEEVDVHVDYENGGEMKWIIDKVNTETHAANCLAEKEAIEAVQNAERARKKAELKNALFKDHEDTLKTLAIANAGDSEVTED